MSDAHHIIGGDLSIGPTGDLAAADGFEEVKQRLLRRLLTNPAAYIFHRDYGAGLARHIGSLLNEAALRAQVRQHLLLEPKVARTPAPTMSVQALPDGLALRVQFAEAQTGRAVVLAFDVTL